MTKRLRHSSRSCKTTKHRYLRYKLGTQAQAFIQKLTNDETQTSIGILHFAMLLDDPGNSVYDPILRTHGCGATPAAYMSQVRERVLVSSSY